MSWPNEHARVAANYVTYSQLIVVPGDTARPTDAVINRLLRHVAGEQQSVTSWN